MGNEDLLADLGLTPEELEEVKNADLAQSRLDLEAAEARRRRIAERLAEEAAEAAEAEQEAAWLAREERRERLETAKERLAARRRAAWAQATTGKAAG
jgi:hypothetical protein